MAFAPNDVLEVRYYFQQEEQIAIVTRHYVIGPDLGNGATDAQIAATFGLNHPTALKGALSAQASYLGYQVQRIAPAPRTRAINDVTGAGVGGVAGDCLPRQVAGIISWLTPFAGSHNRGRTYMPFPAETSNDVGGVPTAGYLTLLQAVATALATVLTAGAGGNTNIITPVLWRTVFNGSPSFTFETIETPVVRSRWATQRRRGSYGQANLSPF